MTLLLAAASLAASLAWGLPPGPGDGGGPGGAATGFPATVAPVPARPFDEARAEALARLRTADAAGALAVLGSALPPATPAARALGALLAARSHLALGRPAEALAALDAVPPADIPPHLRLPLAEERAEARAVAGGPGARAALRGFLARHRDSPHAPSLRLGLARLALAEGDRREATAAAAAVLAARPHRPLRADALEVQARALEGRPRDAALRRLFLDLPETSAAARTGLRESDLSPAERERRATAFFGALEYAEAQRLREGLWADGHRTARLALTLALSHLSYVRDDAARALALLGEAERGGVLRGPERHLLYARALAKLERYPEAEDRYRAYLADGGRKERAKALYYLAWLPYDHGDWERALAPLDRFLREVRGSEYRSYVAWFKAWSLVRLGRHRDAVNALEAMIPMGNNLVAGKALYWGARSLKELGEEAEAARWLQRLLDRYPLSYYAVLGARLLRDWRGDPLPDWMIGPAAALPEAPPFWPFDRLPARLADALGRVKDLGDAGEAEAARRAWAPVSRAVERAFRGGERARLLLAVADATEDYHGLYRRARKEFGGLMGPVPTPRTAAYWQALYPRAQRPLVRVLSERFGFPELWAYAIMRQESRYDARQVSHTAALGIMQMIPSTARRIAAILEVPFDFQGFFEAGNNLLFCTWYLGALLQDFRGQILFASGAYNSGAPAIKRFLAANRGAPLDRMVESIAYNEGRNYARKVAEHLVRYGALHLDPEPRAALYEALFPAAVAYDVGTEIDF